MNYNTTEETRIALSLLSSGIVGLLVLTGCVLFMITFTLRRKPVYTLRMVP